jgi:hypothetical protein
MELPPGPGLSVLFRDVGVEGLKIDFGLVGRMAALSASR